MFRSSSITSMSNWSVSRMRRLCGVVGNPSTCLTSSSTFSRRTPSSFISEPSLFSAWLMRKFEVDWMASAMPSYSLSNGIRAPTISFWLDRSVLLMVDSMDRSPTDAWRPGRHVVPADFPQHVLKELELIVHKRIRCDEIVFAVCLVITEFRSLTSESRT